MSKFSFGGKKSTKRAAYKAYRSSGLSRRKAKKVAKKHKSFPY